MVHNYNTEEELFTACNAFKTRFNPGDIATIIEPHEHILILDAQGHWNKPKFTKEDGLDITLYDLNRTAINQMEDLNAEATAALIKEINSLDKIAHNQFYMVLNHELCYCTIFQHIGTNNEFTTLGDAIITCLTENVGTLKAFEVTHNAIELWVQKDNQSYLFMFFPYDAGVVPYGE